MNALHIQVLWFLALVKILDSAMGELQCIPEIGWAVLPGFSQCCRWNAQRIREETVELFGECHQGTVTFSSHPFNDGFDCGGCLPLGLACGAG
jgi:hypothetical protein